MENQQAEAIITESNSRIKRFFTPKIIFGLLALVILVEIIFAIRTLSQPKSKPNTTPKSQATSSVNLVLIADKKEYNVGDDIPVKIAISTAEHLTAGTDAILRYNPKVLEASTSSIEKGTIYSDYLGIQVNSKEGLIGVSGIISVGQKGFVGSGILAKVNFKAKAAGNTSVNVVFEKGSTTDSNIVDASSSEDVLEKVGGLNLVIK